MEGLIKMYLYTKIVEGESYVFSANTERYFCILWAGLNDRNRKNTVQFLAWKGLCIGIAGAGDWTEDEFKHLKEEKH